MPSTESGLLILSPEAFAAAAAAAAAGGRWKNNLEEKRVVVNCGKCRRRGYQEFQNSGRK
jgi:hypothetical protein